MLLRVLLLVQLLLLLVACRAMHQPNTRPRLLLALLLLSSRHTLATLALHAHW